MQPEHEEIEMSAWLQIHQSLPSHRKTFAVCDLLDLEPSEVVGHLACFWLWALDNAPTGRLDGVGNRVIAIAANWKGDASAFIEALVTARFLDRDDQGLGIHNWDLYAGKILEHRASERERLREHRANVKRTSSVRSANEPSIKEERTEIVQESYGVRTLVVDGREDKSTADKRRQEKSTEQPSAACAADLFDEFAGRIAMDGANAGAVLADAVSNQYGIDCRDFGRLGALAKAHTPTAVLDRIFGLTATWSGKGNPVNYITAAMNGHAKDHKNGNGHSVEKLPTNHQPADLPEVIDWEALDSDEIKRQEDEKDRIALEKRNARLAAEKLNGRPSMPAIFAVGTER